MSLMRSLAIFLHERQRGEPQGARSLPDWQRRNERDPNGLLHLFQTGRG